jgi:hypothetical protein
LDLTRFDENHDEVIAGQSGPAYGVPHAATIEATGALEALPVEPSTPARDWQAWSRLFWTGILAPAQTPRTIVHRLYAES